MMFVAFSDTRERPATTVFIKHIALDRYANVLPRSARHELYEVIDKTLTHLRTQANNPIGRRGLNLSQITMPERYQTKNTAATANSPTGSIHD